MSEKEKVIRDIMACERIQQGFMCLVEKGSEAMFSACGECPVFEAFNKERVRREAERLYDLFIVEKEKFWGPEK